MGHRTAFAYANGVLTPLAYDNILQLLLNSTENVTFSHLFLLANGVLHHTHHLKDSCGGLFLRDIEPHLPTQTGFLLHCIFLSSLVRSVSCHCEPVKAKQYSFCRFKEVGSKLTQTTPKVTFLALFYSFFALFLHTFAQICTHK